MINYPNVLEIHFVHFSNNKGNFLFHIYFFLCKKRRENFFVLFYISSSFCSLPQILAKNLLYSSKKEKFSDTESVFFIIIYDFDDY